MKEIIPENFKALDISVNKGMHRTVHIKQGRPGIPALGVKRDTLTGQVIDSIFLDRDGKSINEISKIHVKCE